LRLGAGKVVGIDIGDKSIDYANTQKKKTEYGDLLEYQLGTSLEIPFAEGSFDVVWSNGVVHHTVDFGKCISEFSRVLKPGGLLYLYVDGSGGLWELFSESMRAVLKSVPRELFMNFLKSIKIDDHPLVKNGSGMLYFMMDTFYAKYEWKSEKEVTAILKNNGFYNFKRLLRGVDSDPIEMIFKEIPYSRIKYGEGQLKFIAEKR